MPKSIRRTFVTDGDATTLVSYLSVSGRSIGGVGVVQRAIREVLKCRTPIFVVEQGKRQVDMVNKIIEDIADLEKCFGQTITWEIMVEEMDGQLTKVR